MLFNKKALKIKDFYIDENDKVFCEDELYSKEGLTKLISCQSIREAEELYDLTHKQEYLVERKAYLSRDDRIEYDNDVSNYMIDVLGYSYNPSRNGCFIK